MQDVSQALVDVGSAKVAVVTHARNESYFLQLWVNYYGARFGFDNLHLLKHGEDWSTDSEQRIGKIVPVEFAGSRKERDAQIGETLSSYCSGLLKDHDFVIRTDCDEFIAPDPEAGSWRSILEECKTHGYIYSLGLDITHHTGEEGALDYERPILDQRRHARVTGEYCKPNVICAPVVWTSACHEVEGGPVRLSESLLLFHLASFDRDVLNDRIGQRGDMSHRSYSGHESKKIRQLERLKEFPPHHFDEARVSLRSKIMVEDDGSEKHSPRFRKVFGRRWAAIRLPDRFAGLIGLEDMRDVRFPTQVPTIDPKSSSASANTDYRDNGTLPHQPEDKSTIFRTPRVHVVRCVVQGLRITFCVDNPKDAIQKHHFAGRFYEQEELDLIANHFPKGGSFCDIGSNVGNHAVYAAKFFDARRVVLFEPNPDTIKLLRCNIVLNGIENICELAHLGIGLSDGGQDFGRLVPDKPNNLGGTAIGEGEGDIPLARGDDLLANEKFDLIKIDVEGLEMKLLAGMSEHLRTSSANIFIEVDKANDDAFHQWRTTNGYRVLERFKRYRQNTNYLLGR